MQPNPIAETSKPLVPNLRFCIFKLRLCTQRVARLAAKTVQDIDLVGKSA
jgi:hypothetical protein